MEEWMTANRKRGSPGKADASFNLMSLYGIHGPINN